MNSSMILSKEKGTICTDLAYVSFIRKHSLLHIKAEGFFPDFILYSWNYIDLFSIYSGFESLIFLSSLPKIFLFYNLCAATRER